MPDDNADKKAWYIGASRNEVGEAAILVGDPDRVERAAQQLSDVHAVPVRRGLRTITGTRNGRRITVSAFGMGAPIAVVVLEELRSLGVHTFVRIGTAMAAGGVALGEFVLSIAAMRREGTSLSYAPASYPAVADLVLNTVLENYLRRKSRPYRAGLFASYDGFYSQMFALPGSRSRVRDELIADIENYGLIAADMETSALLVAGRMLGARTSSICVATVDPLSQAKLDDAALAEAERGLFSVVMDALSGPELTSSAETP